MSDQIKHGLRQVLRKVRCRVKRKRMAQTTFIGITGSCGKTTTTRFLGKILSDAGPCFVGIHENGENSVMRNIRDAHVTDRFFVQELAVYKPGCLEKMMPLFQPHIGIVTAIGGDHYRNFRTLEATAKEKGTLIESLPESGVAVLNADDPHVLPMAGRARARVITYGLSDVADVRATEIEAAWPKRLSLTVAYGGESVRVETDLFGTVLSNSVLAAVAGGLAAGVDLRSCAESLSGIETFSRRMSIHRTSAGVWFINDAGKAPFWSIQKIISQLSDATAPRTTIVFGTFSDIPGTDSDKYRAIAKRALEMADRVMFVGPKGLAVRKRLTPDLEGRLFVIETAQEASRLLSEDVVEDEIVLIKSGNRDHLERLIYGQDTNLDCWQPFCSKMISCETCSESGLPPSNGGQR